jgi:hypothetical protein
MNLKSEILFIIKNVGTVILSLAQLVGTSHYICMSRGSNLRQSLIYLKSRISSHYATRKENVNLTEKKTLKTGMWNSKMHKHI